MIFTNHQYSVVGFLLSKNRTNEGRSEMELIEKRENKSVEELEKDLIDIIACLDAYEDSGLTPDQVMELKERERREMAEHTPDQKARDWFCRPAGVQVMIRVQAEQITDTTKYVAEKYRIRGDADGQKDS